MDANRWPVDRLWQLDAAGMDGGAVTTAALAEHPVLVLVGAAGIGKTTELKELQRLEAAAGRNVRAARLAMYASSAEALLAKLKALVHRASPGTTIYMDALDEAAVLLPQSPIVLAEFFASIAKKDLRIRISCRAAVWPTAVQTAMGQLLAASTAAKDKGVDVPVAHLQPLNSDQIAAAATASGVDAERFAKAIRSTKATALASNPVTLKMLLGRFKSAGSLPQSRIDLFDEGIAVLAREREERRSIGTNEERDTHEIVSAAEVLACCTVLSGRESVSTADEPRDGTISAAELARHAGQLPLSESLLQSLKKSGLCDSDSPESFGFAHRQVAEYLAGKRIAALPLHQAKALLGTALGWQKGVAGPLRETAAFAAMHSPSIAKWIAECDPEVVGLSDVADNDLRRRATRHLLERFRRHELTDAQLYWDRLPLEGFQYPKPEGDLRPILAERGAGALDVLECAVALIRTWRLVSMSDDLATLMLDPTAPFEVRKSAGRALADFGTDAARQRVKVLIHGGPADPEEDLKGVALRCNWGHGLTTKELLAVLTVPVQPLSYGSYAGFLSFLNTSGFDGAEEPLQALRWASDRVRELQASHHRGGPLYEIVQRVAAAAIQSVRKPAVAKALAALVLEAVELSGNALFEVEKGASSPLSDTSKRRLLLTALAKQRPKKDHVWWMLNETPDLLGPRDFPWLLEQATDSTFSLEVRTRFARMAWATNWQGDADCVNAWAGVLDQEPIKSVFNIPRFIRLKSKEAEDQRKSYRDYRRPRPKPEKVSPPPADRVANALALSETKSPEFFRNIISELSLEDHSTHYDFFRYVTDSPGWKKADSATRDRIVDAAVRFMEHPSPLPTAIRSNPLNTIFIGHMEAMLLLLDKRPTWIARQKPAWWRNWTWFIMRELHPGLSDEAREPKKRLFKRLLRKAPAEVRREIVALVSSSATGAQLLLDDLLRMMDDNADIELDHQLCKTIATKTIAEDRVRTVAAFVLRRSPDIAIPACMGALDPAAPPDTPSATVHLLAALLSEQTTRCWTAVTSFFAGRSGIARQVLAADLHHRRLFREDDNASASTGIASLSLAQKVQLVSLLLDLFTPETDPPRVGARAVGPSDSARDTRDRLLNWLGQQKSHEAVQAWSGLFARYGARYPWLGRPKAAVERAFRTDNWSPIGTAPLAALLTAAGKRLIRSSQDAVDGIVEALRGYQSQLDRGDTGALASVWNTPKKGLPSPKDEAHLSTQVEQAVLAYFSEYAVSADREVEIWRRVLPKALGGEPSDEVDVLYRVPRSGTASGAPIAVPIEVKLSPNREARTGLKTQLVDRYMKHLDADVGVFVVVQMAAPGVTPRSLWKTAQEARSELEAQAAAVTASSVQAQNVSVVVLDATLKGTGPNQPRRSRRKKASRGRKKQATKKRRGRK